MESSIKNTLRIPLDQAEFRITIRGSRFLGWVCPVNSEAESFDQLAARSRQHRDATHHCWAFRIWDPLVPVERSSDAGEPSGTAGRPILDAIRGAGLTNVLVVISRWFGGTKLGKGGLIRAYGSSAVDTLRLVRTEIVIPMIELTVRCPYDMIGWVEKTVRLLGGVMRQGDFTEIALLHLKLPVEAKNPFVKAIQEDGGGKVEIEQQI